MLFNFVLFSFWQDKLRDTTFFNTTKNLPVTSHRRPFASRFLLFFFICSFVLKIRPYLTLHFKFVLFWTWCSVRVRVRGKIRKKRIFTKLRHAQNDWTRDVKNTGTLDVEPESFVFNQFNEAQGSFARFSG